MSRRVSAASSWFDNLGLVGRYVMVGVLVLGATAAAELLAALTGSNRVAGAFTLAVLVVSYLWGSGPGYAATVLSFLIYNFLIAKINFHFEAYRAEDVLVMVSFPIVAALTGNLTGRLRNAARRSEDRARATAVLFEATREFSATDDVDVIRARLAAHLAAAAHGDAFVLSGGREFWSGGEPPAEVLGAAREQAGRGGDAEASEAAGWGLRRLAEGGVAGWTSELRPEPAEEALLHILADAGAAAIARAQLAEAKAEVETRARTEDLRNALLSSISHDLRTPLAAVLASATSLQEFGDQFDAKTRQDLTNTIQEEAERLNAFVTNLLNMTRLEAGALDASRAPFDLADVVERTSRRFERLKGARTITWSLGPGAGRAVGDPVLFEVALANVLENAMRYSPDGGVVAMASARRGDEVVLMVTDQGPGVPDDELERLFDKFYRGSGAKRTPGTGLGLSIVRGVMQGMGGSARADLRRDGAGGLAVTLSLPAGAG